MQMQLSFWEKATMLQYEHVVIGAGFVGMHIALQLRAKHPAASIVILERGILPTGASTKNAGFACTGSATELLADLRQSEEQDVLQLFDLRYRGLAYTLQLLGDKAIGFKREGSHELLSSTESYALDELDNLNCLLRPLVGVNAFERNNDIVGTSRFNRDTFCGAISNTCEGEVHTGKLVMSLYQLCLRNKIEFKFGVEVQEINQLQSTVCLTLASLSQKLDIVANSTFIATNAFAKQFLPREDLQPGRGLVLITKPIDDLPFKGVFHMHEGYYYFRAIENRILFGGGRHLDMATECSTDFEINELIKQDLYNRLHEDIAPFLAPVVDYMWTGIMAFGKHKAPLIKQVDKTIFCAVRCGGMGVAIAPLVAQQCVSLL
jgi:gamma-glutamylputrescine oxidase